jgi:hypothetical protein
MSTLLTIDNSLFTKLIYSTLVAKQQKLKQSGGYVYCPLGK